MDSTFHVHVPIRNVTKDITMHVVISGYRWWQIRMVVGVWLIKLASVITGINIKVDEEI